MGHFIGFIYSITTRSRYMKGRATMQFVLPIYVNCLLEDVLIGFILYELRRKVPLIFEPIGHFEGVADRKAM